MTPSQHPELETAIREEIEWLRARGTAYERTRRTRERAHAFKTVAARLERILEQHGEQGHGSIPREEGSK